MGNIIGIDIGKSRIKIVMSNGKKIRKMVAADMPVNLVSDNEIISRDAMGEYLRDVMKKNHLTATDGAVVFHEDRIYVKNVSMPLMNASQLVYNLPYEFKDYITEELKDYYFDYAMESIDDGTQTMELLAAAVPQKTVEDYRVILRRAGLRLVKAVPVVSCYQGLVREHDRRNRGSGDYCFLDLGYSHGRMDVFHGTHYATTNEFEIGMSNVVMALAENMNIDTHLAHTYLINNHMDCQNNEVCKNAFDNMAVELMRTMNFLRYSNPDANFENVYLCGGGASMPPLRSALEEGLGMSVQPASRLLESQGLLQREGGTSFVLAAGLLEDMKD